MENNKISLAIFGNQNSNSGFQPLYWINNPPQQLENIVPPGMDENPYFFTLQVLPAHTQYTLIHNRVSSYMSVRPGVLKMAIAIPKGYTIRDGVSPLEVLLDVRQQFIETCMTLRDAQTDAYNYKEKLADPDIFVKIVDSYQLVPDRRPHFPMKGIEDAVMLLDDMAISELFVAPQHPEFQQFKSIVIANKGNASVYKTQFNGIMASAIPAKAETPTEKTISSRESTAPTTKASVSKDKSAQQKKFLILLLCILLIIGGAVFLLRPKSDKKAKKEDVIEIAENNQKDDVDDDIEANKEEADQEISDSEDLSDMEIDKKEMEDSKQPVNATNAIPAGDEPAAVSESHRHVDKPRQEEKRERITVVDNKDGKPTAEDDR